MIDSWWPVVFLIALILIAFSIPAKWDPAIRLKEKQERDADLKRLLKEGYALKDGKTVCSFCGVYCGQCSDASRHGLTLAEYRAKYWQ
jgi:hypothetical protein